MELTIQARNQQGIYIVVLRVTNNIVIQARNTQWELRTGIYLYFGSARGQTATSLDHRIARHIRKSKQIFWHIDRLTTHPHAKITQIWYTTDPDVTECSALHRFQQKVGANLVSKGFGSSDCRASCQGHLLRVDDLNLHSLKIYLGSSGWKQWNF